MYKERIEGDAKFICQRSHQISRLSEWIIHVSSDSRFETNRDYVRELILVKVRNVSIQSVSIEIRLFI